MTVLASIDEARALLKQIREIESKYPNVPGKSLWRSCVDYFDGIVYTLKHDWNFSHEYNLTDLAEDKPDVVVAQDCNIPNGGVVGLRRWIEKVEQVFETGKCAKEDKVMFAASTFEGRALTWWNGNVHTLGLVNANRIPWTESRLMMSRNTAQQIGKSKNGTRAGNITSSKPATLHDAINMARELVEQSVQGRATRIGESNKRKWEDHQRNPNNNNNRNRNNNYHQQQNRRQETARAYAAVPAEGKVYAGNLPKQPLQLSPYGHSLRSVKRWPKKTAIWRKNARVRPQCRNKSDPLPNDEILKVQGERPKKDFGSLACIKADEKKLDDI
ncbi:hypothetical protein Tco_0975163 [Tanacetum coccineum]|uniref:Reverse transcriptase domain-containing protein n=1 Tax=Tanacetum coccineum TaxID=301880 RepID=A0ABQ5EDM1_9ASTR